MKNALEEIYDSSIKFLLPLNLEDTYKVVVQEALGMVKGDVGSIFLLEGGKLIRTYSNSSSVYSIHPRRRGYTYQAYKNKKIVILGKSQIAKVHPDEEIANIKQDILIPLVYRNKSFGVISIFSKKKKFSKRDIDKLNLLIPLVSLAIRKAQLYKELSQALKTRDLFISMASHELKTPVTTIYTYLQLIQSRSKKGKKYDPMWIDTLLQEMVRLIKLVNELLQINQIKTGDFSYEFEEINAFDVTEKALNSFKTTHPGIKVVFENKSDREKVMLIGDMNKLIQVLTNLLDNSAKHNKNNLPIILSLEVQKKYLKITVTDEGKGIREEEVGRVFEEFYKGNDHTKAGMGLGLYLIKKIIDRHKGKIELRSKLNEGTKVLVKLPLLFYEKT